MKSNFLSIYFCQAFCFCFLVNEDEDKSLKDRLAIGSYTIRHLTFFLSKTLIIQNFIHIETNWIVLNCHLNQLLALFTIIFFIIFHLISDSLQ